METNSQNNPTNNKPSMLFLVILVLAIGALVFGIVSLTKSKESQVSQALKQPAKTLPKEQTVSLTKEGFSPQSVTVNVGDAVRWFNNSGGDATVNSDDYPTNKLYKELNLGVFKSGATLVLILNKPGTYTYHDHFHPTRKGTIIVKG
jgi:plastocyanin